MLAAPVVLGLFLLLAGCTAGGGNPVPSPGEGGTGPGKDSMPRLETTVELYFSELLAVQTGERNPLFGFTFPVLRNVPHEEDTALLLRAAMEELLKGPRPADAGAGPVMPATTRVLSITVADGIATINFSREVLTDSAGGTLGGAVFIDAVVLTATQFPAVDAVQALVEGEPWCDGHFVWEEPLDPHAILSDT